MKIKKHILSYFLSISIAFTAFSPANAQTLYGIIYSGSNAGFLIKIDTWTGDATIIGNTGLHWPCVLEYNSTLDTLLTSNSNEYPVHGYFLNRRTGTATLAWNSFIETELAYESTENVFYGVGPGYTVDKLNPETGEFICDIGLINKKPIGGLDFDPTTQPHVLYGAG